MAQEVTYVIITPYSLLKSRTGGIIARLIARTGLELTGARMFAPSAELAREYAATLPDSGSAGTGDNQKLVREYILEKLAPDSKSQRRRRVMALLFQGENAVEKMREVVGDVSPRQTRGDTIRGTYGDLIVDEEGSVRYFEPAVLTPQTRDEAENGLRVLGRFSASDGGILSNVIAYGPGEDPERTLVLLKPDNFRFASGKPGNMIDFFSRTGLFITGIKVHRMSTAEAVEFYGPVREILRTKFTEVAGERSRKALEQEFGFEIPAEEEQRLGELLGPLFGENQFSNIVRFMSGRSPAECEAASIEEPGTQKCIALVYEGVGAVSKIRGVLGPTDPTKAPPGSIRREFGSSVMVNAAHASDSVENAAREMRIVKVADDTFRPAIELTLGKV